MSTEMLLTLTLTLSFSPYRLIIFLNLLLTFVLVHGFFEAKNQKLWRINFMVALVVQWLALLYSGIFQFQF